MTDISTMIIDIDMETGVIVDVKADGETLYNMAAISFEVLEGFEVALIRLPCKLDRPEGAA